MNLDRAGIFKARPFSWKVKTFSNSSSVAIAIEFVVLAQLDGGEWQDWDGYAEHRVWGDFFVVKKDGKPNTTTVQQLAASIGWDGSLKLPLQPPQRVVQITVKEEFYKEQTYYKAQWINPEDFVPTGGGASEEEVHQLDARFGSLLRAAASTKAPPPKTEKASPPKQSAPPLPSGADDIPF